MAKAPDFTPTQGNITLHGLGFIQVKLPADRRMHVWLPDLPRRSCFMVSSIHNHRFGFRSTVLVGELLDKQWVLDLTQESDKDTHMLISHNGPRGETGARDSFEKCTVTPRLSRAKRYVPGDVYEMLPGAYHSQESPAPVVTIMQKTCETDIHASSLILRGHEFDTSFDRYQLSPDELWAKVREAFEWPKL